MAKAVKNDSESTATGAAHPSSEPHSLFCCRPHNFAWVPVMKWLIRQSFSEQLTSGQGGGVNESRKEGPKRIVKTLFPAI